MGHVCVMARGIESAPYSDHTQENEAGWFSHLIQLLAQGLSVVEAYSVAAGVCLSHTGEDPRRRPLCSLKLPCH